MKESRLNGKCRRQRNIKTTAAAAAAEITNFKHEKVSCQRNTCTLDNGVICEIQVKSLNLKNKKIFKI